MPSLFSPSDNAQIVNRIQSLRPDSKGIWGKMDVAQMLAHAQVPLKVALGDLNIKKTFTGMLFGGMAKRKLLREAQFGHDYPTAKEFKIVDAKVFEKEKEQLIVLVQRFAVSGPEAITRLPHPFFGRMTAPEWDEIQWKHLDHHLRQFGG